MVTVNWCLIWLIVAFIATSPEPPPWGIVTTPVTWSNSLLIDTLPIALSSGVADVIEFML